jgi:hypothetical protein
VNGELLQFAGSLGAVLLLIFVARRLRLGGEAKIADEADARDLADNAVCGFEAEAVALDRSGRGALLRDRAGRILLLAPHGNRFVGRLLDARATARIEGERLVIASGERPLAQVTLDLPDPAAWSRAIEALS